MRRPGGGGGPDLQPLAFEWAERRASKLDLAASQALLGRVVDERDGAGRCGPEPTFGRAVWVLPALLLEMGYRELAPGTADVPARTVNLLAPSTVSVVI